MSGLKRVCSTKKETDAVLDRTVLAGDGWLYRLEPKQYLRIIDVGGNQSADTMFYDADNTEDHYSVPMTLSAQGNIYLCCGSVLRAESGKPLLTITADTCGRHDTLGGSCSAQSNTVRYSRDIQYMHNCRDTFMLQFAENMPVCSKRDLAPNTDFFMNVPVTSEGGLEFADGISAPGYYVEFKAECSVLVLLSNCPQLNNPCNAYNPTPLRVLVFDE